MYSATSQLIAFNVLCRLKTGRSCSWLVYRPTNMYMNNCDLFSPSGTSLRVRTIVPDVGWVGHNSTVGLTLLEVWAQSVQCVSRGKPFKLFGLGHTYGKSLGFRNIPGDWVSASLIPAYARKIWMQTRIFCSRRGYTFLSLFLHRAPRYDPAAQQQSSPLAAAACNCMRVWLLL